MENQQDKQKYLDNIIAYQRVTNYLAVAQIYLQDNFFLSQPLHPDHIKARLLGHWGTAPGINLIYAHLNRLILDNDDATILLVTGPGHGAAAILANLYLEQTLVEYFPEYSLDKEGFGNLIRSFSWPTGFPSHTAPMVPGTIHEGGELGYALSKSFGAVFDNPDLIVACIVGDGEAETGPTATAWHSTKYLDPVTSGAVLPIIHLNEYKIASRTIYGSMSNQELMILFGGYGYHPFIVEGPKLNRNLYEAMDEAYFRIRDIQNHYRNGTPEGLPRWPVLLIRSPKGWTGVEEVDGKPVEGTFRAHQVPIEDVKSNPEHLALLEEWLRSYSVHELFNENAHPTHVILEAIPRGDRRMGKNPHAIGGNIRDELELPFTWEKYAVEVPEPGNIKERNVIPFSNYLRDIVAHSKEKRNFRIVCPDELESNRLDAVLEVTNRAFVWSSEAKDIHLAPDGLVMEILSEHTCQGWLEGYLLTGRHGLFPCYEAFISIISSMMNQFAKFLKRSKEVPWREPISSLNYLLTSTSWRQDHNGYSHQMPGFINEVMTKKASIVRIYLPPDANSLLYIMDHVLHSKDCINLVIASKQEELQWLTPQQAIEHCERGISIWRWASTEEEGQGNADIVMCAAGDLMTLELIAAIWLLKQDVPELRIRAINVTDLMVLDSQLDHPHGLTENEFEAIFSLDKPVIFNFHGYPHAVQALLFERPNLERFIINGYREEGSTTTPLDMMIRNGTSRYHLVLQAVGVAPHLSKDRKNSIIKKYEQKLKAHRAYIDEHQEDPPEIQNWRWS